jgi:pimeloyl-ACP methyl ester carboxylesterase
MLSTSLASAQSSHDHRLSGQAAPDWRPELLVRGQAPASGDRTRPVLNIHGSSFPSATSMMFRLGGVSWADALNAAGFNVFALDFAGCGGSERYPVMASDTPVGAPPGRALEAAEQIARCGLYPPADRCEQGLGDRPFLGHDSCSALYHPAARGG